ncbi:MAG: DUF4105 domain-containing protein [Planctomycetota bacterium]
MSDSTPKRRLLHRALKWLIVTIGCVVLLVATLWTVGAIYFDGPAGRGLGNWILVGLWLGLLLAMLIRFRGARRKSLAWLACILLVVIPWSFIRPSNDRQWKPEWAVTGRIEITGDTCTFHGFRNFDHNRDGTFTERWESRTVNLSNLRGVDVFLDAFGGDTLAHPVLSFDFGIDGYVALSIETRREIDESFSALGGLYKMFELQYLFGDERDFIRVRTNIHHDPVYLYRSTLTAEQSMELLMRCIDSANGLFEQPRFYNVITHNCTTSYRAQRPDTNRAPFDIRLLLNGRVDELMLERGALVSDGLSYTELRAAALINNAADQAHDDPDFPARIRDNRTGFGPPSDS